MGDNDLIRRDDAINAIRMTCVIGHLPFKSATPEGQRTLEALRAVRNVSMADVRPTVHSKWVKNPHKLGFCICEKCKCEEAGCQPFYTCAKLWKFCPNCGAIMDGKDNESN